MDISNTIAKDLYTVLELDTFPGPERKQFLNSIGELMFESAVLKYIDSVPPDEQSTFNTWIQAHEYDAKLISRLAKLYPVFAEILQSELETFKNDAIRITGQRATL